MAQLDLSGFVSPATEFQGLDNLTNTLQRKQAMKAREQQEVESKKAASTKFFANYLDDKEKFTGTKYDPVNHELLSGALNDAMDLINKGADTNDILAAISPKVNRASQYTLNAQAYAANKKAYIDRLRQAGAKGIDLEKLNSEIDNQAFPEGVDVSKVDPNINYGDLALKNGDVFNTEGFDESFKKAPKNTEVAIVKHTNSKGGMERQKVKLTSPYYATSEKDSEGNHIGFVPKYQVATDSGNELIHTFQEEKGLPINAPVRLYDKELFDAMPAEEKAYVLQEARKIAKEKGVPLDSAHMENFARAIAYDEKKARINGTYEHFEDRKENPAPRITVNVSGSKADQKAALTRNDLFAALDETPTNDKGLIDITPVTGGIVYLTNSRGKRISQPSLMFDPKDKTVTFTDPQTDAEETVSLSKFKSMAKSNNAASDLDYLENLRSYRRNSDKTEPPKPKEDDSLKQGAKSFFEKVTFGKFGSKKAEKKESKIAGLEEGSLN